LRLFCEKPANQDFTIAALCEQVDNSYVGHSGIIPSTHFIVFYHLSARHNRPTSPVPEYINELPSKSNSTDECNFIYRVLYKDCF